MPLKRCLDCGALISAGGRCAPCQTRREHTRNTHPSRAGRYHSGDRARWRKVWTPLVNQGGVMCARCGREIAPFTPFDRDHVDGAELPSHPFCNRSARRNAQR